ncbi:coiled-coil-helix-coiled-coil-helix domain-containing protein 7 [Colletes latitarsis]|uniref:coiled-coil-helix-coiled-coil-helix domain-containing protein 7 n=1 Tax=Colletes latitarsis TaxID=2605962 RepID=UPI0040368E53
MHISSPHEAKQAANTQSVNELRQNQELNNPCLKEHNLSLKCLDINDYKHEKCEMYFANYKVCKAFWRQVRIDRKQRGIIPHLPLPEDRDKVKTEYLHSKRK